VVGAIIAINQFTYSFGPGVLGWLRDAYGSYAAALTACLVLQLAAVGVLLVGGLAPLHTYLMKKDRALLARRVRVWSMLERRHVADHHGVHVTRRSEAHEATARPRTADPAGSPGEIPAM
jgi:hypothetical protein